MRLLTISIASIVSNKTDRKEIREQGGIRMRIKKNNEIRTAKEEIMVGIKTTDQETGVPVALIKGKGDKYDTISLQEMAEALYGKGVKVTINTA